MSRAGEHFFEPAFLVTLCWPCGLHVPASCLRGRPARQGNPKPRRLVCRTDAPAWYATQVGRKVELRQTGTDALLATIRPPAAWGDQWGWNLIDGGILVEWTSR